MRRIKHDLDMTDDPLPADFFDLIGGTSTGGLGFTGTAFTMLQTSLTPAYQPDCVIARTGASISSRG
jgi:hypothetical protein